jgi:hypothetical protein
MKRDRTSRELARSLVAVVQHNSHLSQRLADLQRPPARSLEIAEAEIATLKLRVRSLFADCEKTDERCRLTQGALDDARARVAVLEQEARPLGDDAAMLAIFGADIAVRLDALGVPRQRPGDGLARTLANRIELALAMRTRVVQ